MLDHLERKRIKERMLNIRSFEKEKNKQTKKLGKERNICKTKGGKFFKRMTNE